MSKKDLIRKQIMKELINISCNPSHFGTHFWVDAIYSVYENNFLITNLDKYIYSMLSVKYNTNNTAVKLNIYNAILQSYNNCEEQVLENYLHRKIIEKPSTKEIIQAVLENLT